MTSFQHQFTESNVNLSYTYGNIHNRTGFTSDDDRFTFNPAVGSQVDYVCNNLNQHTLVGGISFSYDGNGNLTSDGTNTYTYDAENRLTGATTPLNSVTYTYDPFGRRITKAVDGVITNYFYDSDQVIVEYDSSNQMLRRYVYGLGIDEPICVIQTTGTYYYHFDALGSVIALTDNSGTVTETYVYSPYGDVNSSSSIGNPYLYAGSRYDSETGLYYLRARYYHPEVGRFLQVDPINYENTTNLYEYCLNNPISYKDSDGQTPTLITGAIGAIGGGIVGGITYAIFYEGEWSGSQFWGSVAGGAVTGGLAGLTLGESSVATTGGAIAVGAGSSFLGYSAEVGTSMLITDIWGEGKVGTAKEWSWFEAGLGTIFGGITAGFAPSAISHVRGAWPKYLTTWLIGAHGKAMMKDWVANSL